MITLSHTFTFEAAHYLPSAPDGDPNRRLHGHSFTCTVSLRGEPDADGLVVHFDHIRAALEPLRLELDHRLLNELPELERPTLERISAFIFRRASDVLPGVCRVTLSRPSCGEECIYEPGA